MVVNISPRNSLSSRSRRGSTINNLLNSMGIRQGSNGPGMAPIPAGSSGTTEPLNNNGDMAATGPSRATEPFNSATFARSNEGREDMAESNAIEELSSDDDEVNGDRDRVLRDENGAPTAANMLGTTPFDQGIQNSSVPLSVNNLVSELPITLTLGQNDGPGGAGQVSTLTPNESQMVPKHVRHFVYGNSQPESALDLLGLELPRNAAIPEPVSEEVIQSRKDKSGLFSLRLTPFLDQSASTNPGLYFEPIVRTAGPCSQLVIGRYTERVRESINRIPEHFHPVVFKSKVVSRTHGCFKVDQQGNWYIRDVRSSSGTFLNHHRLAPASTMSKDTPIQDGDVIQLGLDFRGGTEEIYRSVKMRVELNRSWKRRAMRFNREALQRLKNLQKMTSGLEEEDCSICLSKIKPCQAIFISPCSHSWHYQCVRRLVMTTYPQFVCPNCRSSCDLEASLDSDMDSDENDFEVLADDVKDIDMAQESE
ncbi:E3 ubiquitin-protein ligase DMA2 [Lachancea thermotolerans]